MDRSIVTIGNFDGVHVGHSALVAAARRLASVSQAAVIALVFDPHPMSVLDPSRSPARLSTFEDRRARLLAIGADRVERLEPTPELLATPPEAFIERLVRERGVLAFVEGDDFRFGRGRAGTLELLRTMGRSRGFVVEVVPPVEATLRDGSSVRASSSTMRWMLEQGRVADAASILGRAYAVRGVATRGEQRGRTIGFPTVNLGAIECLSPCDGVYGGRAVLPGGATLLAAISIGTKPTFDGRARVVEAHLLADDDADRRAIASAGEYGWPIELEFDRFLREQWRFESVEALVRQMHADCDRVRAGALAGAASA